MPLHHTPLHLAAAEAVAAQANCLAADLKVDTPPRPELGDFAIGCFAIAKARGVAPTQVAQELAAKIVPAGLIASATAAGPFVNLKVDRAAAFRWLVDAALTRTLVPATYGEGKTICIDYSSPNISKHLAYHHIRGTVTGHALVHIFRALGHHVVGINFLGDWGTTHGMLLAAWNKWGPVEPLDIAGLNALYVKFNETMKTHPELEGDGRAWFKRLEDGDPDARALWQRFKDVSWAEFEEVYKILGITFEEVRGESAYEPALAGVFKSLSDKGLVSTSEGAQVIQLPGEKTPLLLRKGDGSTLYATRDIAAAEYHWDTYQFARKLYVVGREQGLHFRQLYKALALAGHTWAGTWNGDKYIPGRLQHVSYGHIRLGGKKTATRLGNVVLMKRVFDIMQEEQLPRIVEKNPERSAAEVDQVARTVGIGAVVFANLASQREKDVDFDIEKVTSTEGDSGPYLQYVHARCASIIRKAVTTLADQVATGDAQRAAHAKLVQRRLAALEAALEHRPVDLEGIDLGRLTHDAEWAVARRLMELPDVVVRAADAAEPHLVCHYLLQLAGEFSYWYTQGNGDKSLRVISDDLDVMSARLALTAAVQAAMATGLGLLGIGAPDWM
ncbi:MAG: arginine--tRNA ligase [Deltaproteobacteria bacterium]|nr:arginine--tRNA ligase [Deltaproteobacteria bacterium]